MDWEIFAAGLLIYSIGFAICMASKFPCVVSLLLPIPKIALFSLYFSIESPPFMPMGDDLGYFEAAARLLDKNQSSFSLLFKNFFSNQGDFSSKHYLYHIYNVFSMELLGRHYFSAVAINIILTFVIGYLGALSLKKLGYSVLYSQIFFIFLIYHWEIIPWSTFYNLKDTLVALFMSIITFLFAGLVIDRRPFRFLFALIPAMILFLHLRFYAVFLLVLSFFLFLVVNLFINSQLKGKIVAIFFATTLAVSFGLLVEYRIPRIIYDVTEMIQNPLYGFVRFALTPTPWRVDAVHQTFVSAAVIHWLTFPLIPLGIYVAYKKCPSYVLLLLTILVVFSLFHGALPETLGPRQRLALLPLYAVFQFIGLMSLPKAVSDIYQLAGKRLKLFNHKKYS